MTKRSMYRGHPKSMENCAEVAQPGRALDSLLFCSGGEAEDRVVAGSNPALGTTMLVRAACLFKCKIAHFTLGIS